MNLVVFDIDGTITDSVKVDDECFIKTYADLFGLDLKNVDWSDFKHVTDWGLTVNIFKKHFDRGPSKAEVLEIKKHFLALLKSRESEIKEIDGALNILKLLKQERDFVVALATGGWKETAHFKLNSIGFDLGDLVFVSSNDHFDRSTITSMAIAKSSNKYGKRSFEKTTYVGDGLWDLRTSKAMGINFIGVDFHQNNQLTSAGADHVIYDFTNTTQFLEWLKG